MVCRVPALLLAAPPHVHLRHRNAYLGHPRRSLLLPLPGAPLMLASSSMSLSLLLHRLRPHVLHLRQIPPFYLLADLWDRRDELSGARPAETRIHFSEKV